MVATYYIGDPVKSFVHVKRTGREKLTETPTETICWDLSRGSTVAGSVHVMRTIPEAIPNASLLETEGYKQADSEKEKMNTTTTTTTTRQSHQTVTVNKGKNKKQKRYLTDSTNTMTVEQIRKCAKVSENDPLTTKTIVVKVLQECHSLRADNIKLRKDNSEIQEENDKQQVEIDKLRQNNNTLQERIELFHKLFQNKNQLIKLVQKCMPAQ